MWNKDHEKSRTLCNFRCESVAHLMNSCRKFSDLYSRRHDRLVDAIHTRIKKLDPSWKILTNQRVKTIFPELREELRTIRHRKPDLIMVNAGQKGCKIIEVTVCFDMYMEQSYMGKQNKYHDLKAAVVHAGYSTDYYVMCFGSLGCVHKDVRGNLRKLGLTHEDKKATMKWCGVSDRISSNII